MTSNCRAAALAIILMAKAVAAQDISCTLTISGRVIEAETGNALPLATVVLREIGRGSVADQDGYYRIDNLCSGTYTLVSGHLGCHPMEFNVTLTDDLSLDIEHHHHPKLLETTEVVGYAEMTSESELMHSLGPERVAELRGLQVSEVLAALPGVRLTAAGGNIVKPVFRGVQGPRLMLMNNGIRQEGQQWGNEHAPEIDSFLADEPAVVSGPSAVRYGPNTISGVLLVNPVPLRPVEAWTGRLTTAMFSNGRVGAISGQTSGRFTDKQPALAWRAQGTLKRGGNLQTPDAFLDNTGIREVNGSYAIGYFGKRIRTEIFYSLFQTELGIFSGAHVGNLSDLNEAISGIRPVQVADFTYQIRSPRQQVVHELVKSETRFLLKNQKALRLTLGRQFNERSEFDAHARFGADSFAPAMRLGITTHTGDLVFSDTLKNAVFLETGLSLTNQRNTRSGLFFIPNFKRQGAGGFLILGKKGRLWAWDASVRSDVFNQTAYFNTGGDIKAVPHDFFGTAGGISIARTLGMRWLIRLQTSIGWRPPGINEQFANGVHHGAAAFERGNANLQKERVLNNALSLSHKTAKTSAGAEFYANRFSGFIYLRPEPEPVLTIRGAFPAFAFDQADVLMTGADLWAEAKWGDRTEIRATASAVRARQTKTGEHLPWIPADLLTAELTRSFRDFGFIAKPRLSAGGRWQGRQWRPDPNQDFAPAPEGFALVNAGFAFSAGPADVRFGVTNILNMRYRDYMNRFRYFHDEPGRNFTLRVDWPIKFKQYQTTFNSNKS